MALNPSGLRLYVDTSLVSMSSAGLVCRKKWNRKRRLLVGGFLLFPLVPMNYTFAAAAAIGGLFFRCRYQTADIPSESQHSLLVYMLCLFDSCFVLGIFLTFLKLTAENSYLTKSRPSLNLSVFLLYLSNFLEHDVGVRSLTDWMFVLFCLALKRKRPAKACSNWFSLWLAFSLITSRWDYRCPTLIWLDKRTWRRDLSTCLSRKGFDVG